MIDAEILEKLQGASLEERILVIEAILQTIPKEARSSWGCILPTNAPTQAMGLPEERS